MSALTLLAVATVIAPRRVLLLCAALFALTFWMFWRVVRWIGETNGT